MTSISGVTTRTVPSAWVATWGRLVSQLTGAVLTMSRSACSVSSSITSATFRSPSAAPRSSMSDPTGMTGNALASSILHSRDASSRFAAPVARSVQPGTASVRPYSDIPPDGSASISTTLRPIRVAAAARFIATVVEPRPGLLAFTMITWPLVVDSSASTASRYTAAAGELGSLRVGVGAPSVAGT